TAGRAAAPQEGGKRRRDHAVAAPLEAFPKPIAAARQHQPAAEVHRIGRELGRVLAVDFDALGRRNLLANEREAVGREGARVMDDVAGGERAKRGVEMVIARIDEFERDAARAEVIHPSYYHLDTAFCALPSG